MKVFKITYQDRNFGTTYTQYEMAENELQCAFRFGKVCYDCPMFDLVSIEEEKPEDTIKRVDNAIADLWMSDAPIAKKINSLERQRGIAQSNLENRA